MPPSPPVPPQQRLCLPYLSPLIPTVTYNFFIFHTHSISPFLFYPFPHFLPLPSQFPFHMQITQSYHPTFHHSLSSISLSFPTPCYNSFLAMTSFQLFLYPLFISSSLPLFSSNLLSFSSPFLFSLTFLQSLLHLYLFHPIHRPLSIYSINPHPMLFKILPSSYLPVNLPFPLPPTPILALLLFLPPFFFIMSFTAFSTLVYPVTHVHPPAPPSPPRP